MDMLALAHELHLPLAAVEAMPVPEFHLWRAYFKQRASRRRPGRG